MADERHQEHGGQEAVQGTDEEIHGKKKVAGNVGSVGHDAALQISVVWAQVALASLHQSLNLFLQ